MERWGERKGWVEYEGGMLESTTRITQGGGIGKVAVGDAKGLITGVVSRAAIIAKQPATSNTIHGWV